MTSQQTEPMPEPTDPSDDQIVGTQGYSGTESDTEGHSADESDTEGHSLLTVELARTLNADRARETSKLDRDMARQRDAKSKDGGGFFKRLGRR